MININIETADNGLILKIEESTNGIKNTFTKIYKVDTNQEKIDFLSDFCGFIDLDLGAKNQKQLVISEEFGSEYYPAKEELNEKIKEAKELLSLYKDIKKVMNDYS